MKNLIEITILLFNSTYMNLFTYILKRQNAIDILILLAPKPIIQANMFKKVQTQHHMTNVIRLPCKTHIELHLRFPRNPFAFAIGIYNGSIRSRYQYPFLLVALIKLPI